MKIAYNLVWIAPTFAEEGGSFNRPLPPPIEANIAHVVSQNSKADVFLWVDKQRLTQEQWDYLERCAQNMPSHNLRIRNLRDISEYNQYPELFNIPNDQPDDNAISDYDKPLWRQADTARIMAALQTAKEGYEQVFYADADISNLCVDSVDTPDIQEKMAKFGIILCDGPQGYGFENGMFAFSQKRRRWFEELLERTLPDTMSNGRDGFYVFEKWVEGTVLPRLKSLGLDDTGSQIKFSGKQCPIDPELLPKKFNITTEADGANWRGQVKNRGDISLY